ncbi:MAG: ester cyclase, partial [Candidatus Tectomicrobia bacterium]|nr:ester cyclase [Candidatus Tectomicrobia bacterium]
MSEANKALARRFLEETQNTKNLAVVDELVAPVFVGHTAVVQGITALKDAIGSNLAAFPDLQITIEDQRSEGNTVVSRYTARGTHRGVYHGIAPTGKAVTYTVITMHGIADGQIAEGWRVVDRLHILEQLGA